MYLHSSGFDASIFHDDDGKKYVELPTGEGYLVHLCARPFVPESSLPEVPMPKIPNFDDFDGEELGNYYYAPRINILPRQLLN